MKHFLALALIVAVASAAVKPTALPADLAQLEQIWAAINHPSTDPATAALLTQMLQETLGVFHPEPIAVGPAIVDQAPEGIAVGPAIVDGLEPIHVGPAIVGGLEPISVGPAIVDQVPNPAPAVVGPSPAAPGSPLVQIILNINQAGAAADVPTPSPVIVPEVVEEGPSPSPVHVVDTAPVVPDPVIVVEGPETPVVVEGPETPVVVEGPEPIQVVEPEVPEPAPVVVGTPTLPEPVVVGEPALPVVPEVILPEDLN